MDGLEKKKMQGVAQDRQLQELKFIGLLVNGIVHDFNNAIGIIRGYADLALRATSSSDRSYVYLKEIIEGADLSKDLAEKLRVFTKQKKSEFKLINIHSIVEETIKIFEGSGKNPPIPHPEERSEKGSQRSFDPVGPQDDQSGTTVKNAPTGQILKESPAALIDPSTHTTPPRRDRFAQDSAPQAQGEGTTDSPVGLHIQQDIDTTCTAVLADADQIQQVVINLCNNAYDAMCENGGVLKIILKEVDVGASLAEEYEDLNEGRYVKLTICDTGHGMDQEILKQIFEPFFTTKKTGENAGLGLSVVHEIIKVHKGEIIVESHPGEGAKFDIYFPLVNQGYQKLKE